MPDFLRLGAVISCLGAIISNVIAISSMVYDLALAQRRVTLGVFFGLWVVIVVCEVTLFYLVFTQLLHVPLPEGIFI